MNKLYFVYEPDECAGVMVAATSNNQAKMIGCGDICCDYIDTRARLVKSGDYFYDDMDSKQSGIKVIGEGVIETALRGTLEWEYVFKPLLLEQKRGELFTYDEEGNEIKVVVEVNHV